MISWPKIPQLPDNKVECTDDRQYNVPEPQEHKNLE